MADQTEATITIAAAPSVVMAVIADMEAYPTWNGEVKEVEVLSRSTQDPSRPGEVRFVLDAGALKDEYTLSYSWDDDRSVRWRLVSAGMLTAMDGTYVLAPNAEGNTDVTYRLQVDIKVPMIGMIKRKAEKVIIDRALKGLKQRVEG